MKKNRMMRLASGLLVAVLITTSTISGTFAKYVTTDSASDSARVAKWGVTVTATDDNDFFKETYDGTVATSVSTEDLVAPGTRNDTGVTFAIAGKPEVDGRIVIAVNGLSLDKASTTVGVKDVVLKAGTYENVTTGAADDEFVLNADYYPVKFTLTQTKAGVTTTLVPATPGASQTLAAVEAALENLSTPFEANDDLDAELGTLKLTWAWDFGTAAVAAKDSNAWVLNIEDADKADTILGNLAAGKTVKKGAGLTGTVEAADYNLETGFEINVLVEQVD